MSQRVEFAIQPMLDENAVKGASLLFLLTLFVIEYFISCLSSDNQSINQSINTQGPYCETRLCIVFGYWALWQIDDCKCFIALLNNCLLPKPLSSYV